MAGDVGVSSCVAVRRFVTATDVSTLEADSQVEPAMPDGQAVLAASNGFRKLDDLHVRAVLANRHSWEGASNASNAHRANARGVLRARTQSRVSCVLASRASSTRELTSSLVKT